MRAQVVLTQEIESCSAGTALETESTRGRAGRGETAEEAAVREALKKPVW
jgi:hypothetical protein